MSSSAASGPHPPPVALAAHLCRLIAISVPASRRERSEWVTTPGVRRGRCRRSDHPDRSASPPSWSAITWAKPSRGLAASTAVPTMSIRPLSSAPRTFTRSSGCRPELSMVRHPDHGSRPRLFALLAAVRRGPAQSASIQRAPRVGGEITGSVGRPGGGPMRQPSCAVTRLRRRLAPGRSRRRCGDVEQPLDAASPPAARTAEWRRRARGTRRSRRGCAHPRAGHRRRRWTSHTVSVVQRHVAPSRADLAVSSSA